MCNEWMNKFKSSTKNLYKIYDATSFNIPLTHGYIFCDVAKDSFLTRKIFCHMDKGLASKHGLSSFGGIYLLKWRFINYTQITKGFLRLETTLEIIAKIKLINPFKDNKNIAYSINDIHYTMKLIFPTSSLEIFH